MPIVPDASDGYLAWALLCILQVLLRDQLPGWETISSATCVAPTPGLELPQELPTPAFPTAGISLRMVANAVFAAFAVVELDSRVQYPLQKA